MRKKKKVEKNSINSMYYDVTPIYAAPYEDSVSLYAAPIENGWNKERASPFVKQLTPEDLLIINQLNNISESIKELKSDFEKILVKVKDDEMDHLHFYEKIDYLEECLTDLGKISCCCNNCDHSCDEDDKQQTNGENENG